MRFGRTPYLSGGQVTVQPPIPQPDTTLRPRKRGYSPETCPARTGRTQGTHHELHEHHHQHVVLHSARPGPDITSYKEFSQPPTQVISNMTPRTSVTDFNDREIAGAYLLTLKRVGREHAWAAMEASTPEGPGVA